MGIAERVYESVKELPEERAAEVLDFVERLKSRSAKGAEGGDPLAVFDRFAGRFTGSFHREECYDRQILR